MKMQRGSQIVARGEDGETLRVVYSNRGEPYREGCEFEVLIATDPWQPVTSLFLERREMVDLRDALTKLLGE